MAKVFSLQPDNRSGSEVWRKVRRQSGKIWIAGKDHLSDAMEADDLRRPFKSAKHHDHPPVFTQVCNRLDPASGKILISHRRKIDDSERVSSLWRAIQISISGQRGGCHKKERLLPYPGGKFIAYFFVYFCHRICYGAKSPQRMRPGATFCQSFAAAFRISLK
jgi:hypothetical protein